MDKANSRKRSQEPAENTDDDMDTAPPPHKKTVADFVDLTEDTDNETRSLHRTSAVTDIIEISSDDEEAPESASQKCEDIPLPYTIITPFVYRLAGKDFGNTLRLLTGYNLGDEEQLDAEAWNKKRVEPEYSRNAVRNHDPSIQLVQCTGAIIWEVQTPERLGRYIYKSVQVGLHTYQPGDAVLFRGYGEQSSEPIPVFGRVEYIFQDDDGENFAHTRSFVHGEYAGMGEKASPNELFMTNDCFNFKLQNAVHPIKLRFEESNNDKTNCARQIDIVEDRYYRKKRFFYRLHGVPHLDKENERQETGSSFTDASLHEGVHSPEKSPSYCYCCEWRQAEKERLSTVIMGAAIEEKGNYNLYEDMKHSGVIYHRYDFVYLPPSQSESNHSNAYQIGQILEIRKFPGYRNQDQRIDILVRNYERYDNRNHSWDFEAKNGLPHVNRDSRRLYCTIKGVLVSPSQLFGKCLVLHPVHIEDFALYKEGINRFWIDETEVKQKDYYSNRILRPIAPDELSWSQKSLKEIERELEDREDFLQNGQRFKALHLFAGLDAFSFGSTLTSDTRWTIDLSAYACRTLKQNSKGVTIFHEDISTCLRNAILESAGEREPSADRSGNIASMPDRDEVDILYAGFPCPGYTRGNLRPKAYDQQNTLILGVLSYVQYYAPKCVLLENVKDILIHKLGAEQVSDYKTEGGIEGGTIKLILRALTAMGYQVHIATLQASEYGAPADRSRVIIWAALPGCELPEFPQPTHASTGSSTRPVASWHRKTHFAPHAMISFAEATSDLPKFEYQNPHNIIGQTATDRYIRTERAKTIRQCRVNPGDSYVGRDSQDYASPPISDFQRQCRNGSAKVTNHVTRAFHDKPSLAKEKNGDEFLFRNCTTERICNIPIEASADHGSLPAKLRQGSCYHPANDSSKSVTKKKYCYSRIKYDEPMRTVRTRIDPASKWGRVLHPYQHRVVSNRELCRMMGIPDSFHFDVRGRGEAKDATEMIGNSIPIPLTTACHRPFLECRIRQFVKEREAAKERK